MTVEGFLKAVLRSGLFDQPQLDAVLAGVPPGQRETAQALADYMVRKGKLSRYQAKKLLQGAAIGLMLGPYQVLAPIGKGGMGVVYLARDRRNDRLTALKVLAPHKAEGRRLARFQREMEISQKVNHPHIALDLRSRQIPRRPLHRHGIHPWQEPFPPRHRLRARCALLAPRVCSRKSLRGWITPTNKG